MKLMKIFGIYFLNIFKLTKLLKNFIFSISFPSKAFSKTCFQFEILYEAIRIYYFSIFIISVFCNPS